MFTSFLLRRMSLLLTLVVPCCHADVKVATILGDHMVLQRDQPIHLWGWADPGEAVSAEFHGSTVTAAATQLGRWDLTLPAQPAGGPFQITISGHNTVTLNDVLLGDVWFASGQSNMEFPLNGFPGAPLKNGAEETANANYPDIRFYVAHHKSSLYPLRDFDVSPWTPCTPDTAKNFSAVAYFFGREISKDQHVPIGLIDSSWGGTPVEAWISYQGFLSDPSTLQNALSTWTELADQQSEVPLMIAEEKREDAAAQAAHQPPPHHDWHPDPMSWVPSGLYNGMVSAATGLRIKGVIWYQGETNSALHRAAQYEKLFPLMIKDWREHWGEGNFPFLFVQISSFTSTGQELWPIVREAQRRTLAVPATGMAVTIDVGEPRNVHPANKQDVGHRLAIAARALVYGEKLEYSGPLFSDAVAQGASLRVAFTHADGLTARGGAPAGFEVAGADHRFVPAEARIERDSVVVSSPSVTTPRYVRFGWANVPDANLFNADGLPASPFTSEEQIPPPMQSGQ